MYLNTISSKKSYLKPRFVVIDIDAADIIATSNLGFGDDEDDGNAV